MTQQQALSTVYVRHLHIWGLALMASSVLYLVAANWWMLPQQVQLALPMLLLICAVGAYWAWAKDALLQQVLSAIIALMLGLSLAVIGQVYQTGADSYWLFVGWSILLIPWLFRLYPHNGIMFLLLCLSSQLAVNLFFHQTYYWTQFPISYVFSTFVLVQICIMISFYYYQRLSLVLALYLVGLSIYQSLLLADQDLHLRLLVVILLLPLIDYCYKKKHLLILAILTACVGLIGLIFIIQDVLLHLFDNEIGFFLVLALCSGVIFSAIAYGLFYLKLNHNITQIPLAVGAWLSGWALAGLIIYLFSENFWFLLIFGSVIAMAAVWGLTSLQSVFQRQLLYSLFVVGQVSSYWAMLELSENFFVLSMVQLVCVIGLFYFRLHGFVLWLQLCVFYFLSGLSIYELVNNQANLTYLYAWHNVIFLFVMISLKYLQPAHQRIVLIWSLVVIFGYAFIFSEFSQVLIAGIEIYAAISCLTVLTILYLRHLTVFAVWSIGLIGLAMAWIGYFELVLVLWIWLWAIYKQEVFLYYLASLCFAALLWYLYYDLNISFLYKSATIFLSGILLFGLAYLLQFWGFQRSKIHEEK